MITYDARSLHDVARRNFGIFSLEEAAAFGWDRSKVRRAANRGEVRRLLPGIYAFTAVPSSKEQREVAALRWAGGGAALGKFTAAARHQLDVRSYGPVQLMTNRRLRPPHAQIEVFRRSTLPLHHVERTGPFVLVSVARALFDLAWHVDDEALDAAMDSALSQRKTTLRALWQVWHDLHASGCNGCRRFLRALMKRSPDAAPPANLYERRFLNLIEGSGLPTPVCQHHLYDEEGLIIRADFAFLSKRLAVEAHSRRWHMGHGQRIADDIVDQRCAAIGWGVLRFWWQQLEREPTVVAHRIGRALAER